MPSAAQRARNAARETRPLGEGKQEAAIAADQLPRAAIIHDYRNDTRRHGFENHSAAEFSNARE